MKGSEFIEGVRRGLKQRGATGTDHQVADYLGMSAMNVSLWKRREEISVKQMTDLLERSRKRAIADTAGKATRVIVEFFPLDPVASRGGGSQEIFSITDQTGGKHPYRAGLKAELERLHGVYLFYDSRGRALYAGKARRQSLWREANLAFNRDRKVQKIRRVDHPMERRHEFKTSEEKHRQIRDRVVTLDELAKYFSAYEVTDSAINDFESLLIRAFPNDLLNIRMENLERKKRST